MKLLTIGMGTKGAILSDALAKRGARVNRARLFKCYAVANDIDTLRSLKSIPERDRYHLTLYKQKDVGGVVNTILERYELFEGTLLLSSLGDDFGYTLGIELAEKFKEAIEEPVLGLATLPDEPELAELRRRIREFRKAVDILMLFKETEDLEKRVIESLNLLALVGEIDLKKRQAGEVVVDTSDVFNALIKEGVSAIGTATRRLPPLLIRKILMRKDYQIKGIRSQRMIDMLREACENLSVGAEVDSAKSALIVFSGSPEEITMDGLFDCISLIEEMAPDAEVRYGDYPCKSRDMSLVLLFSGITKLKF
ncbi:MAG: cell division protein [Archaeoglobales archaeon]|nr:MAG: cell division protein [Archaeoglobales archaeon]